MGTPSGTGAEEPKEELDAFECPLIGEVEAVAPTERWLIESLWAAQGVGLVGGTPKTGKTWAVLELALSVASGTPAFDRFDVHQPGPVLFYGAEDRESSIRERVAQLCLRRGVELGSLPLRLVRGDRVHLDSPEDRLKLERALGQHRPRLLVLDPLVRLHTGSESTAQHVAELLGYLRSLQRGFELAIMVTHHLSKQKGKAAALQPGQALRGSGDLHAWGDSNLYLSRCRGGAVKLHVEQRNAHSFDEPLYYRLAFDEAGGAHLEVLDEPPEEVEESSSQGVRQGPPPSKRREVALQAPPLRDRILKELEVSGPVSQKKLRGRLRVRNQLLTDELRSLEAGKTVVRGRKGWHLAEGEAGSSRPVVDEPEAV